ncbi:uncharacterized protein LOC135368153 isoform X5 [Ornithodoros turicata]|uniref:uncharacterized protein LOC135368153 isoform X5 n=1 Tax=Ornithodoros turicata TaxID=34597 RepID=UPI003138ECFD
MSTAEPFWLGNKQRDTSMFESSCSNPSGSQLGEMQPSTVDFSSRLATVKSEPCDTECLPEQSQVLEQHCSESPLGGGSDGMTAGLGHIKKEHQDTPSDEHGLLVATTEPYNAVILAGQDSAGQSHDSASQGDTSIEARCRLTQKGLVDQYRRCLKEATRQRGGAGEADIPTALTAVKSKCSQATTFMKDNVEHNAGRRNMSTRRASSAVALPERLDSPGCSSTTSAELPTVQPPADCTEEEGSGAAATVQLSCSTPEDASPSRVSRTPQSNPRKRKWATFDATIKELSKSFTETDLRLAEMTSPRSSAGKYLAELLEELPIEQKRLCESVLFEVIRCFREGNECTIVMRKKNTS